MTPLRPCTRIRKTVAREWSAEETTLLKELYPVKPVCEVAKTLGRTIPSIQHKAYSLGVKTRRYVQKLWTAEELELLKKLYPTSTSSREVADKIGRPWGAVRQKAYNLTLGNRPRTFDRL